MSTPTAADAVSPDGLPPIPLRSVCTPRKTWRLVAYPLIAGPTFALLTWVRLRAGSNVVGSGFVIGAAILGFLAGLVCCPFIYAALRNRDLDYCLPRISWSVLLLILIVSILPADADLLGLLLLLAAPAIMLLTCAAVAAQTPRLYFGVDVCRFCGYNLQGSYGSGRCPECGWDFTSEIAPGGGSAAEPLGRPRKLAAGILRHPLLLAVALILLGIAGSAIERAQVGRFRRALKAAIATAAEQGGAIDLGKIASFPWDRAHVLAPPADEDDVAAILGFPWPAYPSAIGPGRENQVLVFVYQNRVVHYCVLSRYGPAGVEFDLPDPIVSNTPVFAARRHADTPVRLTTSKPAESGSAGPP